MVTLPPQFVATKYPGYFFNTLDKKLYSIKIDGILKPLKLRRPNRFNHLNTYPVKLKDGSRVYSEGGFMVSVKGRSRFYAIEQLVELEDTDITIPVLEKV